MNRAVRLAAVAALGVLLVVTVVQGRRGHVSSRPQAAAPIDLTVLGAEGGELARLLERGRDETFHATYKATAPEQSELAIELWRKPPRQRQDQVLTVDGRVAHTSSFALPGGWVACAREERSPWSCRAVDAAPEEGPDGLLRLLVGEVTGPAVDVRDDTIAGAAVRCFRFPLPAATADVCATRTGVPARISDGSSLIELTSLSPAVAGGVLTPPASTR